MLDVTLYIGCHNFVGSIGNILARSISESLRGDYHRIKSHKALVKVELSLNGDR